MRPKVFINLATDKIGGPGKGVLQFLRFGGLDVCDPVIVNFKVNNNKGQFCSVLENKNILYQNLNQRMTYDPFLIPQALKIVNKYKLNILESHGYKSHLVCMSIKRMTGIPWIAFFHGWTSLNFKIKCYNILENVLLGCADRIVPVSQGMIKKLNLRLIDKQKIRTIYNAVDPSELSADADDENIREKYGIKVDDQLAAVVGRFSPEKGHIYLVNALPKIHHKFPNLKVMFIGEGNEEESLKKIINEMGLNQNIIFTGYQEDLGAFYKEIDLLILPSLSEGMPNVALEAMLYSKPVVATRVGGVPEVVMDGVTGKVVDPYNSEQLANAVTGLLENSDDLLAFGMAGRQRVIDHFCPVQRVKNIAALYEDVLSMKNT